MQNQLENSKVATFHAQTKSKELQEQCITSQQELKTIKVTLDEREQDFRLNNDRVRAKNKEIKDLNSRVAEKQEEL